MLCSCRSSSCTDCREAGARQTNAFETKNMQLCLQLQLRGFYFTPWTCWLWGGWWKKLSVLRHQLCGYNTFLEWVLTKNILKILSLFFCRSPCIYVSLLFEKFVSEMRMCLMQSVQHTHTKASCDPNLCFVFLSPTTSGI